MTIKTTGILECIRAAKNADSPWADTALAELGLLTGQEMRFERKAAFDCPTSHEIVVAP